MLVGEVTEDWMDGKLSCLYRSGSNNEQNRGLETVPIAKKSRHFETVVEAHIGHLPQ